MIGIVHSLCTLTLRHLFGEGTDALFRLVQAQLTDNTQRLAQALQRSNDRAWKALTIALGGESWCSRNFGQLIQDDVHEVSTQIQGFLCSVEMPELSEWPWAQEKCLSELQQAQRDGLLQQQVNLREIAQSSQRWVTLDNPRKRLQMEAWQLEQLISSLHQAGYPSLSWLLKHKTSSGKPFLVVAARYFFQREVETDPELFRGLTFQQMYQLDSQQQAGFQHLERFLQRREAMLDQILRGVTGTHQAVLDLRGEMREQMLQWGQQHTEAIRKFYEPILEILQELQIPSRPLRLDDSGSIRTEYQQSEAQRLLEYHQSVANCHQGRPALVNALGKLGFAAHDHEAARQRFRQVAVMATSPEAKAEAFFNEYQVALAQREWTGALQALNHAVRFCPQNHEPFPFVEYEPVRILGAGGFGVTFLCRYTPLNVRVAVKALRSDVVAGNFGTVEKEARALERLRDPKIIQFRAFNYADQERSRPYLVTSYFEGQTLQEYVEQNGPLFQTDLKELARVLAGALKHASEKGVIHRDVKPANILVSRTEGEWDLRLIDFGLAKYKQVAGDATNTVSHAGNVTGTIDYAAPEQMGRVPVTEIDWKADVYGFGRTCCYALFKTARPVAEHWDQLTSTFKQWLSACIHEHPDDRPRSWDTVLAGIRAGRVSRREQNELKKAIIPTLRLVVLRGLRKGAEYILQEGENLVGRSDGNPVEVDLEDQELPERIWASRQHAKITLNEQGAFIEDLGSSNGTFLNRQRIEEGESHRLHGEDVIQIGAVQLKACE